MLVLVGVVFRPFREWSAAWYAGFLVVSAASGFADLLDATPPSPDGAAPVELPQTAVGVAFEDVSFTSPERSTPALRDVSFTVESAETVAIVSCTVVHVDDVAERRSYGARSSVIASSVWTGPGK
jgi:ATP-binding cassette subfamily C protein CydCD